MIQLLLHYWPVLCGLAAVLTVLWIVAVLAKYVRLMLNIFRDTPPFLGLRHQQKLEGHIVQFRAFDGTRLRGMFLSPAMIKDQGDVLYFDNNAPILKGDSKGVIIFCHEYNADMYSWSRYCMPLLRAGYDIFAFDFRSHGKSESLPDYAPRLWCTNHEVADCLGALAYVNDQFRERELDVQIGMFGISRGAGAAILAADSPFSAGLVKAVLADSAFSNDTTLEMFMKRWVHIFARVRFVYENHPPVFWRFLRWLLLQVAWRRFHCRFLSARKALMKLKDTPTFFIHGARDSYIRPDQAKLLYEAARPPRYLWMAPEAKHNQSTLVHRDLYALRSVAFFDKFIHRKTAVDKLLYGKALALFAGMEGSDNLTNEENGVSYYEDKQVVQQQMAQTGGAAHRPYRRTQRPEATRSLSEKTSPMPPRPE